MYFLINSTTIGLIQKKDIIIKLAKKVLDKLPILEFFFSFIFSLLIIKSFFFKYFLIK